MSKDIHRLGIQHTLRLGAFSSVRQAWLCSYIYVRVKPIGTSGLGLGFFDSHSPDIQQASVVCWKAKLKKDETRTSDFWTYFGECFATKNACNYSPVIIVYFPCYNFCFKVYAPSHFDTPLDVPWDTCYFQFHFFCGTSKLELFFRSHWNLPISQRLLAFRPHFIYTATFQQFPLLLHFQQTSICRGSVYF